jgi:hypothetical protein
MMSGAAAGVACAWVWVWVPPLLLDPPGVPFGLELLPPALSVADEDVLGFVHPMKKESTRSRTTQSKRVSFTQPPCAQNSDLEFVPEQLCLGQLHKRTMH